MIHIKEVIIVEGKYDKIRLSSVVDGMILETNGFRIFKDKEMRDYLKRLASERGIVILTDSDRAGFLIRNHIKSFLPAHQVKQAYIPEIKGVEKRKRQPSKEGLLGVEGIDETILLRALEDAGCCPGEESIRKMKLTESDLFSDGLSGKPQSAQIRREMRRKMNLPGRLSSKEFLQTINCLLTETEYRRMLLEIMEENSSKQEKTEENRG